jgi:hypothetical protein
MSSRHSPPGLVRAAKDRGRRDGMVQYLPSILIPHLPHPPSPSPDLCREKGKGTGARDEAGWDGFNPLFSPIFSIPLLITGREEGTGGGGMGWFNISPPSSSPTFLTPHPSLLTYARRRGRGRGQGMRKVGVCVCSLFPPDLTSHPLSLAAPAREFFASEALDS